jgi:hypothetical protein
MSPRIGNLGSKSDEGHIVVICNQGATADHKWTSYCPYKEKVAHLSSLRESPASLETTFNVHAHRIEYATDPLLDQSVYALETNINGWDWWEYDGAHSTEREPVQH